MNMNLRRTLTFTGLVICSSLGTNVASAQQSWNIKRAGTSAEVLTKIVSSGNIDALSTGAIDVEPPDGPMPETAYQEITLKSGSNATITSVKTGCSELGLSSPAKDIFESEPDLVCTGRYNGESVSVYAKISCESNCKLMIETRAIGF
ncbi:hypothetical protein HRR99_03610 [Agrobacterium vaccinii]|uniref:hypothetical protein n=1 Tax=Agrobacterium vaccinii TaxID=2735528 RepID=UPI001E5AEB35|nr:hypothetical protein [Agrobacterium vaccinii]UHS60670.1 hypothetical protein HRR99_03610 [Agrobacterium vaccinii]